MDTPLFQEFEKVSAKQWKQKIQYDLKGADYNQKLIFKSRHGIDIKPFYHPDDAEKPHHIPSPVNWKICEKIYVASASKSNNHAKEALTKGAESLWFIIPSEKTDLNILFSEIDIQNTPIFLAFEFLSDEFILKVSNFFSDKKHLVSLQIDIVGNLARSGNWFHNLNEDHKIAENSIEKNTSFKSILSVDATLYQNAGATIPQELAYSLAHINEYLNHFKEKLNNQELQFCISVGSNYFFEIAKIRALRLLYASLAAEYDLPETCRIIAVPTKRDKTLYDYNVNLLRTTTQSMSAILGGANVIYNLPYDAIYHKNNEFGDRIARNQLLILKNESYFNKVSNAVEGAYYIENLTSQFALKALEIFKEIEKGGGFLKELKNGTIQKKINESSEQEQQLFDDDKLILIGTNKYENPQDTMKNDLELYPFLKMNPRKTLIQPILERRLAEKEEKLRLEGEEKSTGNE